MFKELLIAIGLGSFIGLLGTFGYKKLIVKQQPNQNLVSISITPTIEADSSISPIDSPSSQKQHDLNVESPINEEVVDKEEIVVKGTTSPLSQVVIHNNTDTFFLEADTNGIFSKELELEAGINIIQITSLSPSEEQIDKDLLVTFSTAQF